MSPAPRPRPRPRAVTPPRRAETGSSLGSAGGPTATAPAPHAPYVHPTRFTAGENSRRAAQTRTPRARARTASRQAPDGPRVRLAPASEPGVPPRDDPGVAARERHAARFIAVSRCHLQREAGRLQFLSTWYWPLFGHAFGYTGPSRALYVQRRVLF